MQPGHRAAAAVAPARSSALIEQRSWLVSGMFVHQRCVLQQVMCKPSRGPALLHCLLVKVLIYTGKQQSKASRGEKYRAQARHQFFFFCLPASLAGPLKGT